VPLLTRNRYWQIRQIRIALEGLAAELAVDNVKEEDIPKLLDFHTRFVEGEKNGDDGIARRFNREFHFGVYRLCNMSMLINQIESMWISMGPILNVYYREIENDYLGAEEHENVLKALSTRDGKAARQAIEADIVRGGMNLLNYFDRQEASSR
jgi:DNA-binding GntR family transcriptional regulator